MAALLIRGGRVVTEAGAVDADVVVEDGVVVEVGDASGAHGEELDAAGLHVLPGAVDAHVHLNEPGRTDWEGFATGTLAAAAGGTTCVADMPLNAQPPTVDAEAFRLKAAAGEAAARTDFALWGGLVPGGAGRLAELAEAGVVGFKAFMCPSGSDDFPAVDDLALYDGMREAAAVGLPVAVHAESASIAGGLAERAQREGRRGWRDYAASRPVVAELEAIARAIVLAGETGCSLHVVHVSSGRGVRLVAEARARGIDVTCETCPHYLLLDEDDLEALGAVAKCAPQLRSRAEVEALWTELAAGHVDLVASDHSPAPRSLKESDDAFAVWGGVSGCQTLLAALLTAAPQRGLGLHDVARLVAAAPARRLRLAGKGRLEPGRDADLVLVDLDAEDELAAGSLRYRHRHSPFVGRRFRGRVVATLLRGEPVWRDGAPVGAPRGRLVRPERADGVR